MDGKFGVELGYDMELLPQTLLTGVRLRLWDRAWEHNNQTEERSI